MREGRQDRAVARRRDRRAATCDRLESRVFLSASAAIAPAATPGAVQAALVVAPAATAAQAVTSLTLINANTDQPIAGYDPIPNGATLNLATLPTTSLSVRANTSPATVGSVRFAYDNNSAYRVENTAPYAIAGDASGDYNAWTPTVGSHTLTVTPYTAVNNTGTAGTPLSITFTVTNGTSGQPTVSVAATDANAGETTPNTGTFTITRTGATTSALTVNVGLGGSAANGSDYAQVTSPVTIPAGSASATVTVSPVDDNLVEGSENVVLTVNAGSGYAVNSSAASATVTIADNDTSSPTPTPSQSPYTVPFAINATGTTTIEVENYDKGGEGVAYHDAEAADLGSGYRTTDGVDVEAATDTGGGYAIGHVRAGEWTEYTVNVATTGKYDIGVRFASAYAGGQVHVELSGTNVTGGLALNSTGGWQTWQTFFARGVTLNAGQNQILRLGIDSTFTSGQDIGNINWISVAPATPGATPPAWPSSWQSAGNASTGARFESAATVLNGKIYEFGGFLDSQWRVARSYASYDPTTNAWTNLGNLPAGMAETHLGIAEDGQYIYFAGGFGGDLNTATNPTQWISDAVWRYDPTNNSWSKIATLPQARGAGTLDVLGRELHYFGGNPADRITNLGDHFVYNLDSGAWSTAAALPNPKDHLSSVVLNGKIYALAGEHGHDQLHEQQSDMRVYDPATNNWTQLASLPIAKSHMEGGTFVSDGKIIMAGGQVNDFQPTSNVVAYDPAVDKWTTLTSLPAARQGGIVRRIGNKVIVALGATQTNSPQATVWTGTLPTQAATTAARLLGPTAATAGADAATADAVGEVNGGIIRRTNYTLADDGAIVATDLATDASRVVSSAAARPFSGGGNTIVVAGKKVYLIGGTGDAAGKVQIYDPARNRWRVGPKMPFAASESAATVLGGKIYVAGGLDADGQHSVAAAARFNPTTKTWKSLLSMPLARAGASAVADGSQLCIVGGQPDDPAAITDGETSLQYYDPKAKRWTGYGAPGLPAHPPGYDFA